VIKTTFLAGLVFLISGTVSLGTTKLAIPVLKGRGFEGTDLHKARKVKVAEMGGIGLVIGLVVGVVAFAVSRRSSVLLVSALVLALLASIGVYDDLNKIRGRFKLALCFLACIAVFSVAPLEPTDFLSSLLPVSLIPAAMAVGVAAAANAANILAGFNGIEAGTTAIGGGFLLCIAYLEGSIGGVILSSALIASCLGFLWFNRYPAKVFPGDVGTLPMGGALALTALVAGVEYLGPIIFLPHLVELGCKMKNKFAPKESTGHASLGGDGKLNPGDYAAFVHFLMRIFPGGERRLVHIIWMIEVVLGVLALITYLAIEAL